MRNQDEKSNLDTVREYRCLNLYLKSNYLTSYFLTSDKRIKTAVRTVVVFKRKTMEKIYAPCLENFKNPKCLSADHTR